MNQDFWNLIKKGDDAAFSQLYNQYSDMLYGYGMKIIANDDLVCEAIQNLFVYIFEKRETLSCPDSLKAYLYSSLKRSLVRTISKKNSITSFASNRIDESRYDFKLTIDIETALIQGEYKQQYLTQLQESLDTLSPQQREVIYLKYYNACSNDEISEILGINNQIVRNIASIALKKIRENGNFKAICVPFIL